MKAPAWKLASFAASLGILAFGLQAAHAQFSAPTCTPPNCSPTVIQNISLAGATQVAGINISGDAKIGATFQAGANAPVLSAAGSNLYYGNVSGFSSLGALMLLQTGGADRFRVDLQGDEILAGTITAPIGGAAIPSYTFAGSANTGLYAPIAGQIAISTGGVQRVLVNGAGTFITSGQLLAPVGTVLAPGISYNGDNNTGIFHSAADNLSLVTNGVGRLQIDPSGAVTIPGTLSVTGSFSAASFSGDGSGLTNLNASNIASGTLNDARLSANVALLNGTQTFTGANTFSNAGNSFTGNGSNLTSLNATQLTGGAVPSAAFFGTYSGHVDFTNALNNYTGNGAGLTGISASNITTGTLPAAQLPATVAFTNANQTFSGTNTFSSAGNSFNGTHTGNGAGLTALNASNLSSGTVPSARVSGTYSNVLTLSGNDTFSGMNTFGSNSLALAGGQNVIYGLASGASSGGSMLLLQKGAGNNVFAVDTNGYTSAAGRITSVSSLGYEGFLSTDGGNNSLSMNEAQMQLIHGGVSKWLLDSNGNSWQSGNATFNGGLTAGSTSYLTLTPTTLASLPAPTSGAMYYDSGTNKFMCYAAGVWSNCAGLSAEADTLQTVLNRGGSATVTSGMSVTNTTNNTTAITGSDNGGVGVSGWGGIDGVQGWGSGANSIGVQAAATNGLAGLYAGANGTTPYGIYVGNGNPAAWGLNAQSGTGYGVFGSTQSGPAGGWFTYNSGATGIMLATPSYAFDASGNARVSGTLTVSGSLVCLQNGTNCPASAGLSGSGTANYVTKFTAASTVGNSMIQDNGTSVGVGTTPAANTLLVAGPTALPIGFTATTNAANGVGVYGFGLGSTATGVYGQGTGAGVVGVGSAANSVGLQGTGQFAGVTGTSNTTTGNGVQGSVSGATSGSGVYGVTSSTQGFTASAGVYGYTNASGGSNSSSGVYGVDASTSIFSSGVWGVATSGGTGVTGQSNTAGAYGMVAYNSAGGNAFQAQGSSNFAGAVSMSNTLFVGSTAQMNSNLLVSGPASLSSTIKLGSLASDPAGSNGMMYYNTGSNTFRCYANGAWGACGGGSVDTLNTVTTNGNTTLNKVSIGSLSAPTGQLSVTANWDGSNGALTLVGDRPTIRLDSSYGPTSNDKWLIHVGSAPSGGLTFFEGTNGSSWNNRMSILTTGEVGIGGTAPAGTMMYAYNPTGLTYTYIARTDGGANGKGVMAYGNYYGVFGGNTSGGSNGYLGLAGAGVQGNSSSYDGVAGFTSDGVNGYGGVYGYNYSSGLYGRLATLEEAVLAEAQTSRAAYNYGLVSYATSSSGGNFAGYFYASGANAWGVAIISGGAEKPGGGSWSSTSDARTKKDVSDFKDGLDVIRKLNPVNYTYNGLAQTPEGLKGIGFIAQDVKNVAPYLVLTTPKKLHPTDAKETDIYEVDPSALPFIDLNAIKELDLRIDGLEAKVEKIDAIDAKVQELESRVQELEAQVKALQARP